MKFTNGYWLLRKEMEPAYAVEYASHKIERPYIDGISSRQTY